MFWWPVLIVGMAILVLILAGEPAGSPIVGEAVDMRPVYLAVLVTGLVFFAAARILVRGGPRTMFNIAILLGAIGGLATAFVLRDEAEVVVHEIRSELMPSVPLSRDEGMAELGRGIDGHYRTWAQVNGVPVKLMIDTGASMVLIPYEKASGVGIDPEALDYSVPVATANGSSAVAPVLLSSIKVGSIMVYDVPAAVAQPGRLKTGLLGMSFLDRLDETSFQKNKLILRQETFGIGKAAQVSGPAN